MCLPRFRGLRARPNRRPFRRGRGARGGGTTMKPGQGPLGGPTSIRRHRGPKQGPIRARKCRDKRSGRRFSTRSTRPLERASRAGVTVVLPSLKNACLLTREHERPARGPRRYESAAVRAWASSAAQAGWSSVAGVCPGPRSALASPSVDPRRAGFRATREPQCWPARKVNWTRTDRPPDQCRVAEP